MLWFLILPRENVPLRQPVALWETTGYVQAEITWKIIYLGDSRIDSSVSWKVEPDCLLIPSQIVWAILVMIFSVRVIR